MSQEIFATQNSNTYGAELTRRAVFAQYARTSANTPGLISGGLISSADLQLSAPASGMSVNVGTGEAIIGGTEGGVQGGYYARNTAQQNLVVAAANATNPRIDTVAFTAGDSLYTEPSDVAGGTNAAVLAVVTGTPTAGATLANLSGAAAVPLSSLVLGYVLVPANSTNVTGGNISNVASPVYLGVPAAPLGSSVALSPAFGTVYQASTTRATQILGTINTSSATDTVSVLVGPTSTPGLTIATIEPGASVAQAPVAFVLPRGWYYELTKSGGPILSQFWQINL